MFKRELLAHRLRADRDPFIDIANLRGQARQEFREDQQALALQGDTVAKTEVATSTFRADVILGALQDLLQTVGLDQFLLGDLSRRIREGR